MALDTSKLISDLTKVFSKENSPGNAAKEIAEALEAWIKTADVKVTAQPKTINVVGNATSQTNPELIPISGKPYAGTGGIT